MFYNGVWGTVCGFPWDLQDARVVCRQLGFKGALAAALEVMIVNETSWFISVRCVGSENSITECDHSGWPWSDRCMGGYSAIAVCIAGRSALLTIY